MSSSSKARALPKDLTAAAQVLQSVAKPVIAFLMVAVPILIKTVATGYEYFQKLPQNALHFIYGFVFCFFGGTFPVLFAAIQAAEHGGREKLVKAIADLSNEAMVIIEESKKDDKADDDNNGKQDVDELSGSEYIARKTKLVLRKMNPNKVDEAVSAIYSVWLAVAAVLSIQFARTISLALSISKFLHKPSQRFIEPTLRLVIPDEYEKWIPVVMSWITKAIGCSIAWYVQTVLSAVSSALTGGLMMSRAFYEFCVHRGFKMFGWIPDDPTLTNMDEILSYGFAGLGLYVQFKMGFSLPFPLNLILAPFKWAEYYIRWSITKSPTVVSQ